MKLPSSQQDSYTRQGCGCTVSPNLLAKGLCFVIHPWEVLVPVHGLGGFFGSPAKREGPPLQHCD